MVGAKIGDRNVNSYCYLAVIYSGTVYLAGAIKMNYL